MEDAEAGSVPISPHSKDPHEPDEFDVEFKQDQKLLPNVDARREQAERLNAKLEEVIAPRIKAHLDAADAAMNACAGIVDYISDRTDLSLDRDSRQVAVFLLIGRLTGLGRATIALLRQGFCAEVVPTIRVMHETSRVLHTVADRNESEMLERWLADDWVKPWEARKASDRLRQRSAAGLADMKAQAEAMGREDLAQQFAELMETAIQGEDDLKLSEQSRNIYAVLSQIGHSRRSGITDALSVPLRRLTTGPHPDPRIRGEYVMYGSLIIEEALLSIGDGISTAFWLGMFTLSIKPLVDTLGTVREAHPLEPEALDAIAKILA